MTPQRAAELLPVIQAFAEGKKIEVRPQDSSQWLQADEPCFVDGADYRIKPQPREWWLVTQNGIDFFSVCSTHPDVIHVREVLE